MHGITVRKQYKLFKQKEEERETIGKKKSRWHFSVVKARCSVEIRRYQQIRLLFVSPP